MTPNEHDDPVKSEELPTTELYPFAPVTPGRLDDTMPDLPVMEQLPDSQALPDPGYLEMPTSAGLHPGGAAPAESSPEPLPMPPAAPPPAPPESPPPPLAPESVAPPLAPPESPGPAYDPADGPSARSWPLPPGPLPRPSFQPFPSPQAQPLPPPPSQQAQPPEPFSPPPPSSLPHPSLPQQAAEAPKQVWSADPYAPPRAPAAAPPLHGPSVPWSQVRAAADYEAASEELAAPPSLHVPAESRRPAASPPSATVPPSATGWEAELAQRPTSAALTSDLLLPGRREAPDGGWRQAVYRVTGGLVRVGESSASMQRRDLVSRIRTPVAGGHHRVAVLSLKGGVGKTTATVGLGATLASLRGDRVIAVDGNPDRGTLSDKVQLETTATIRDLLNRRAMVGRYADVRSFTSRAPSGLEILASDRDPGASVAFSADDYHAVARVLEHYYSICITDCGTGLLNSAMAGILELADQIVLVSSPSVDGARSASATLDWLDAHGHGDLVRDAVVVLSAVRRKGKSMVDLDRLEQHFAARCRAVVRVPYDPHLEEGAEVHLEYLDPETADAYLCLAALIADGFARPGRSSANVARGF
jgi:MinD-like ATPase involved in chromosome partitioning or flagellar assembly